MEFEVDDQDLSGQLVAAKLHHTIDLIRNEIEATKALQDHYKQFTDHRLKQLEDEVKDHEQRLRAATDGVTQFKMWSSLANGGTGLLSVIALVKSFLGGL